MAPRINKNIRFFNMIEVALAMAIIAFGMTSILGLFPVGLNACRNSIAENCASDSVEQFASYLKGYAESSKANFENLFGYLGSPVGLYTANNPMATPATVTAEKSASKNFLSAISTGKDSTGLITYAPVPVAKGWTIFPYAGPIPALTPDMYFTVLGPGDYYSTATAKFPTADFSALIVVWKSPLKSFVPNPGATAWIEDDDVNYDRGGGLNVEISWPLNVEDYYTRQKRTFYIEITKPQQ